MLSIFFNFYHTNHIFLFNLEEICSLKEKQKGKKIIVLKNPAARKYM